MHRTSLFDADPDRCGTSPLWHFRAALLARGNALGRRLAGQLVAGSLLLALVATAAQLWFASRRDLAQAQHRLVEIGRSSVESEPGSGTTFRVWPPIHHPSDAPREEAVQ